MKTLGAKLHSIWLLFSLCVVMTLTTSAISVVPDSPADAAIMILFPLFFIVSVTTFTIAAWRTSRTQKARQKPSEQCE